jgi:hypothetical protein
MKVIEAKALPEFRLFLRFDDGVSGVADLSALAGRSDPFALSETIFAGVLECRTTPAPPARVTN